MYKKYSDRENYAALRDIFAFYANRENMVVFTMISCRVNIFFLPRF